MSTGVRDRFYQTKTESFAAGKRREYAQLEMQEACVKRVVDVGLHQKAITPANVDRLNADDVDVWQSILFPGGSNGGSR